MNKDSRKKIAELQVRRMKFFEREFLKRIHSALQSQVEKVAGLIKVYGVQRGLTAANTILVNESMFDPLYDLYRTVSVYFAKKMLKEIKGFGDNPEWKRKIVEFLNTDNFSTVAGITETTRKQIRKIIDKGVQEGWGIDQIVRALETDELTLFRARLIVRTELVKAMNLGHKIAEDDSPFETVKIWIAAHDTRTRHSHREIDGVTINEEEKFEVNRYEKGIKVGVDRMDGPGDPTASIENLANCRCTMVKRAKRDANGRLIRKVKINTL